MTRPTQKASEQRFERFHQHTPSSFSSLRTWTSALVPAGAQVIHSKRGLKGTLGVRPCISQVLQALKYVQIISCLYHENAVIAFGAAAG